MTKSRLFITAAVLLVGVVVFITVASLRQGSHAALQSEVPPPPQPKAPAPPPPPPPPPDLWTCFDATRVESVATQRELKRRRRAIVEELFAKQKETGELVRAVNGGRDDEYLVLVGYPRGNGLMEEFQSDKEVLSKLCDMGFARVGYWSMATGGPDGSLGWALAVTRYGYVDITEKLRREHPAQEVEPSATDRSAQETSGARAVETPVSAPLPKTLLVRPAVAQEHLRSKVTPQYPPVARRARVQGSVILEATISRRGSVEQLRLVSGHPLLVEAAIEAVKQWRYEPFESDGVLTEARTQITVTFTLG